METWIRNAGARPRIHGARDGGPAWNAPREISDPDSPPLNLAAAAGIGPTGDGVVLWHSQKGVEAVVRAPGHSFGTPRLIPGSTLSMPDLRPQLAFDAKGATLAIWSYFQPHPRFVQDGYAVDYTFGLRVASRSATGRFGRSQTLTDRLDADPSADVAFDPKGNAVVIWTDDAGMHAAARAVGRRRFGQAQASNVTAPVPDAHWSDPQVVIDKHGNALAVWGAMIDGHPSIQGASFDAS